MKGLFYRSLLVASRVVGLWFMHLIGVVVAAGFFIFSPRKVNAGRAFYAALFPNRGRLYPLWCTWRQYLSFVQVYVDRVRLQDGGLAITFEGREHLRRAVENRTGGILIMSHLGNWEVAARMLQRSLPGMRLMLYMGIREREDIDALQKQDVIGEGVRIFGVDRSGGSPTDIVEAIRFLRSGGLVSLAGDRTWQSGQRTVAVRFLDRRVRIPEAPYVLAIAAGVPLFVFFAFHRGRRRYHFTASASINLGTVPRSERSKIVDRTAQRYAALLEAALRRHPFQWHHFEPLPEAVDNPPVEDSTFKPTGICCSKGRQHGKES